VDEQEERTQDGASPDDEHDQILDLVAGMQFQKCVTDGVAHQIGITDFNTCAHE